MQYHYQDITCTLTLPTWYRIVEVSTVTVGWSLTRRGVIRVTLHSLLTKHTPIRTFSFNIGYQTTVCGDIPVR